jgi:hypothetical protein
MLVRCMHLRSALHLSVAFHEFVQVWEGCRVEEVEDAPQLTHMVLRHEIASSGKGTHA